MKSASPWTHWLLGLAFGGLAGGFVLEAGVLALLLIAPGLLWAWREPLRPLGLGGFLAGIGSGWLVLLGLADQRCRVDAACSMPDQTGFLVVAGVLIVGGAVVSFVTARTLAHRSRGRSAGRG